MELLLLTSPPAHSECRWGRERGRSIPFASNFSLGPDVSFRDETEVSRAAEFAVSVENDPFETS
jgi:hypothetical protein